MQFTMDAADLSSMLKAVKPGLTGRSMRPVQQGVRLFVEGTSTTYVAAAATDLERVQVEVHTWADGALDPGEVVVPHDRIAEFAGAVRGPVTVTADETNGVRVTAGKATITIRGMPAQDWQAIPAPAGALPHAIPADTLADAIDAVIHATGKDETRPVLTGVSFEGGDTTQLLAATDTYRLATAEWGMPDGAAPITGIVPAQALRAIRGHLDGGNVTLYCDGHVLEVGDGDITIRTRLIEGKPVNWRKVLPNDATSAVACDRAQLVQAIRRVLIVAREDNKRTEFRITDGAIEVSGYGIDVWRSIDVLDALEVDGLPLPGFEWAVNGQYLLDAIGATQGETVALLMTGPLDAFRVAAVYDGAAAPSATQQVLMPMRTLPR